MKKTKKLLAILAAMAMAMSPISVLADTATELPADGSNTNKGNVEGAIKEELISVELPTVGDNAFNFILDPQLLIERTDGVSHNNGTGGSVDVVTEAGTSVYFKNANADAYAVSSTALSVTNKSSMEINVSVKAELKMSSGDAITVVTKDAATTTGSALNLSIKLKNVSSGAVSYIAGESDATCEAVATATMAGLSADNFKPQWNGTDKYEYVPSGSAVGTTTAFVFEGSCNKEADWTKVADMQADLIVIWNITQGGGVRATKDGTVEWTDTTQPLVFTIDTSSFGGSQLSDFAFKRGTDIFGYNGSWGTSNLKDMGWLSIDGNTVTINVENNNGVNVPQFIKANVSTLYVRLDGKTSGNNGTFTISVP